MLLKPLAFAATAAAALVVPRAPDMSLAEVREELFKALPIDFPFDPAASSKVHSPVSIACPQCKGRDTHLQLDFAVEEGSRLTLNGFELYPNADPWSGDLTASVVRKNGKHKTERLGYGLSVEPIATDASFQTERIKVRLNIIEVGGTFVDGVPVVELEMDRAITDDLAISSVTVEETLGSSCNSFLCRLQDITVDKFNAFTGCVGKLADKVGLRPVSEAEARPEEIEATIPPHGDFFDDHAEKSHGHDWPLLIKNVASHIFLPVLMGITAGVGVALLAMVLCSVAIRLTSLMRSKRSRKSGCCRKKHSSRQQAVADVEKVGLMEEQVDADEAPPEYKDDETAKN